MFLTIYMHQFGWLSERGGEEGGGNFLNLLQKEESTMKECVCLWRGVPSEKGEVPTQEETMLHRFCLRAPVSTSQQNRPCCGKCILFCYYHIFSMAKLGLCLLWARNSLTLGNYRVWIHSEMHTWHDKNIKSVFVVFVVAA